MLCEWKEKTGKLKTENKNENGSYYYYFDEECTDIDKDPYFIHEHSLPINRTCEYKYFRKEGYQKILFFNNSPIYEFLIHCDEEFQNSNCSNLVDKCKEEVEWFKERAKEEDDIKSKDKEWNNKKVILPNFNKGCFVRLFEIQNAGSRHTQADASFLSYDGCDKMLYYYICRYTPLYFTELFYALTHGPEGLNLSKDYKSLNILSLGCGNAVDLFAFDYFCKNRDYISREWGGRKPILNRYLLRRYRPILAWISVNSGISFTNI